MDVFACIKMSLLFIAWMQFVAAAMMDIRRNYKVQKNWMGDPCVPQAYKWEGVNCSYQDGNSPSYHFHVSCPFPLLSHLICTISV